MEEGSKIILYTTPDGKSRVSLMSRDGRVWLNQKQMAELFAVSKMNISLHVSNILKEKELDDSVVKFYLTTAADGKKYKIAVGCDPVDGKLLISQSGGLLVGRRGWNPRPYRVERSARVRWRARRGKLPTVRGSAKPTTAPKAIDSFSIKYWN